MPLVQMHASTSNFDTFTALWLVFALYFLRRGFAGTNRRWLALAAIATGLALATKPTAWFAMPGLGLSGWRRSAGAEKAAVSRADDSPAVRLALTTLALCAFLGALMGTPFLLRNVISRGYLLAPPRWQDFQLGGNATGFEHRLRLLEFNTFALGRGAALPAVPAPDAVANGLDPWFRCAPRHLA